MEKEIVKKDLKNEKIQTQQTIVYGSCESTTIRNASPCTKCVHNGHITCVLKQPCRN